MRRIVIKLVKFVDLTESVPCPEVRVVDVYSCTVAFDGCVGVLELKVLMAHESPRTQVLLVQFDCPLEIDHCFVMVASQAVVIADSAARFRSVLVIVEHIISEVRQLAEVLFDVQNVAVQVKVLIPVRVLLEQLFEVVYCN